MIGFQLIDILVVVVVIISAVIGIVRGGTREVFSVIAWVGSVYITVLLLPYTRNIARSYINHGLIADFTSSCILFIFALTALSLLNYSFSNIVKKSALRSTDKALGGMFGVARAVVILAVVDFILGQCFLTSPPEFLEKSRIRPFIANISNFIVLILPEKVQDEILSRMSQLKKKNLMDFVSNNLSDYAQCLGEERSDTVIAADSQEYTETTKDANDKGNDKMDGKKEELAAESIARLRPKSPPEDQSAKPSQESNDKKRKDLDRLLGLHSADDE
jgi:membrane protein required for colicin V production